MLKYLPFALKNSIRNRRRTLLTLLSVGVSLFLLATLLSLYFAFYHRDETPEQALRLIVRHRVSLTFAMPEFYGTRIAQLPGVRMVCRQNWFGGTYMDRKPEHNFPRFSVDADKIFDITPEWKVPAGERQAFERERTAAAVGRSIADRLGFRLGQKITLQGDIFPGNHEFTLRAIFEGPDDGQMLIRRDYLEETLPLRRRGMVGFFSVMADSAPSVPRVAAAIDEVFRNSPQQTKTESERAFNLSFVSFFGDVKLILFSISGAVTFTILLVSATTMAMSVRERIQEVGVLKTLGFTSGKVLALLVSEAIVIALAGGILGTLLAKLVILKLSQMPMFFIQGMQMPPAVVGITLGAALLIGVASSILPALSAARRPITEALRHAG